MHHKRQFLKDAAININLHLSPNDLFWVLILVVGTAWCTTKDLVLYLSYNAHNEKKKRKDAAVIHICDPMIAFVLSPLYLVIYL